MSLSAFRRRRVRDLVGSAVVCASVLGSAGAATAQASPVTVRACDASTVSRTFLPWGDLNSYKLVPGGDFEGGLTGWSLNGAAGVVAGSEPFGATGSVGSASLSLATGAWAQSSSTCLDPADPTIRFFARTDQPGSVLAVSGVYPTVLGSRVIPLGLVKPGASWSPTPTVVLAHGTVPLAIRLTQVTGTSQVDDVFVDPHTMH
jgi:hypothetical protein